MADRENIEFVRLQDVLSLENEGSANENRTIPPALRRLLAYDLLEQDRSSDMDALLEKVDTNIRLMQRNAVEIAELRTKTRAILAELQAVR